MATDFKLYPPQRQALITPASEILYGGALGGGKSYLARVASIIYSIEIPGLITYLFRRTFKEVISNHIHTPGGYLEMLHDLIDNGDVVYSKSDYSFTFWNGSRIQLAHSQFESDIYAYQGAQIGFLILDEATSSLDSMSEDKIKQAIIKLKNEVTQIIVAHRFSTIEHADRIIVIENGVKIGDGVKEELLVSCPTFRALWEAHYNQKNFRINGRWCIKPII